MADPGDTQDGTEREGLAEKLGASHVEQHESHAAAVRAGHQRVTWGSLAAAEVYDAAELDRANTTIVEMGKVIERLRAQLDAATAKADSEGTRADGNFTSWQDACRRVKALEAALAEVRPGLEVAWWPIVDNALWTARYA